jgi:hypothetical protein
MALAPTCGALAHALRPAHSHGESDWSRNDNREFSSSLYGKDRLQIKCSMKVTVLSIQCVDRDEYEVQLQIGETNCGGRLRRDPTATVWITDSAISDCLQSTPMACKHVAKTVGDYARGRDIRFPVDLGEF